MGFRDLIEEELKKKEQERQIEEQKRQITQEISIANEQRKNNILPTSRERRSSEILPRASARRTYLVREKKKLSKEVSENPNARPAGNESTFEGFINGVAQNPNPLVSTVTDIMATRVADEIEKDPVNGGVKSGLINFLGGGLEWGTGLGSLVVNPLGEAEKKLGEVFNNQDLYNAGVATQNRWKALNEITGIGSKITEKTDNETVKTINQVSRALGNMAPSIGLSVLTGGASAGASTGNKVTQYLAKNSGRITQALGVAGNEMTNTLNEDNSNFGQATLTGLAKGGLEYATEGIFGGNILSKGTSLDDLVAKSISSKVKSNVGQMLLSKGYEFGGEIAEEIISDTGGNLVDKIVNGKDMPSLKEWWENSGETAKTTFLTTAVLQALGLGGGTYNDVKQLNLNKQQEAEAQSWISEAENIIKNTSGEQNNQRRAQINHDEIYTKNKESDFNEGIQYSNVADSSITNRIPPSGEDVNTSTKYSMQESGNNSASKNNEWQTYLDKNYENTGTGRTVQDVKIAPTAKNELNKVAKNQETLYNNSESESGINGERQNGQRTSGILGELDTRLQQKEKPQQSKKYTRTEYEQWEQSIKPITNSKLTQEQRQLKNNIKRQYGKDIVFFDGNKNDYNGGASLKNTNNIYINRNDVNEFGINKIALHEVLESNIAHNPELKNDIINPTIKTIINDNNFQEQKNKFWEGQEGDIPSDYMIAKDILCDRFSELKSGEKLDYDNILSQETNMTIDFAIENFEKQLKNSSTKLANNIVEKNKTLNPVEISNLNRKDANTTPELKNKTYEKGNKQSSFLSNITTDAKFLNEDLRQVMSKDENIQYYKGITNKETLEKAYNKLQEKGQEETIRWHSKESQNATAEDVAEGWILLKQYQDKGDYQSAVEVAKKMREIGTKAGQTVQAYNILSRLTPEGMFYYVQSELDEAYSKMVEGKSRKWIEENQPKFNLTPEETQFILDTMQEVSKMPDGYDKKVKLAEIQKMYTDKIPATAGQSVKAWMRISMLFNPKTQVRNVMGNTVIMPVNMFSDSVSAGIDKLISKRTGIRTTGNTNIKSYAKGFGKGFYESYNDFKKGVNTRNVAGNRFEVTEGKSFNNKGIGKALNRVDNLLSFMLDAGDRGFYEATFTNSINNQLVLNNTTEVTQDMIDIATTEALQRTWQDNNNYTKAVLGIRKILNNVNVKGYGLGDVLIPFAKTPANLTKAIVDYSPVGLVKTLTADARKFSNSLQNGQYTPQLQHQFVQNLGKATAGSFLYVLGYALAQAGVITGEADEDKDVKNFMKNSLGIGS